MGGIIALILIELAGSVTPGGTTADPAPPEGTYPSPQRITAPKEYLSGNAYCRSVSNGCVVCYRDEGTIRCTEEEPACTPRRTFRCNRF